jgi:pyruvate,water dikinase
MSDLNSVGGKNASLGEMMNTLNELNLKLPQGYALTTEAYSDFIKENEINQYIKIVLKNKNLDDIEELNSFGQSIREKILSSKLSKELIEATSIAWKDLNKNNNKSFSVAVRSSATAEDLPNASFAGQQESYLNISNVEEINKAVLSVYASLYTDRAISYRKHNNFDHSQVLMSVCIQQMIRSDLSASGVMFTIDTESGCKDLVVINSSFGLGELIVQGLVNPDEFFVFKPSLRNDKYPIIRKNMGNKTTKMIYSKHKHFQKSVQTVDLDKDDRSKFSISDTEIVALSHLGLLIEQHYGKPMDIEWAKDGIDGELYILQARPETVVSANEYHLDDYQIKSKGKLLVTGRSVGYGLGIGKAKIIHRLEDMFLIDEGDILVTDHTDPNWEPVMKKTSAIITNKGGRTCHAAIIARELGIPAVVGCLDATNTIQDQSTISVSCAEGDKGFVYEGAMDYELISNNIKSLPEIDTKIMINIGNPDRAFYFASTPNEGVGLARIEFIINRMIGIHPNVILDFQNLDEKLKTQIEEMSSGYESPREFYVAKLTEGISTIASAFYPKPVIVRLSDFKSNEYASLIGGDRYEPNEENPMLGFRGASRYLNKEFKLCFKMECEAILRTREQMGLDNIQIMIPFVRTVEEAKQSLDLLKQNGLKRGRQGLKIIMMCELPSNALMAKEFLEYFDGMSIGSNDLTQLTLGLDRDSGLVAEAFNEQNQSVKKLIQLAIQACKKENKYVGICGQGPSDYPNFARWLVDQGIESISLNPDSVIKTWIEISQ